MAACCCSAWLLLPISADADWKPTGAENPTLRILGLLAASIGLPYFVLSTTGPLLQAWFARERSGLVPYRLFALSNFGSMLALLAYPLVVEPFFPTRWQSLAVVRAVRLFRRRRGLLRLARRATAGRLGRRSSIDDGPAPPGRTSCCGPRWPPARPS